MNVVLVRPDDIQKHALIIENKIILRKINFTVAKESDRAEENEIMESVIQFTKTFRNGDLVFCYFSGCAVQLDRNNDLRLNNDATIDDDRDVEVFGASLTRILDRLTENKLDSAFVIILNCCRPYFVRQTADRNRK